ncbi:hypothetical protein [Acinetobacter beijerinckii]|uniref:Uncharacterized protein n=1 Tax=Acinetobacter beijerinckii CIP 110307 TaxID=1217648 RepID=N9F941_9GAMM|nr:hypothetical protein [Acinetobacter beijerinckii]ENW03830.1 hypothetical protein F933_02800 [Acinetobacter beijerinckii CIP 110307]
MDDDRYNTKVIFIVIIIIFVGISYFIADYLCKLKAVELSEKQDSIVHGCLSLKKSYSDKNAYKDYDVDIDGKEYVIRRIFISDFPFVDKYHNFIKNINKNVSCYKIKYVKVKFLFVEKRYIYDLVE